MKAFDTEKTLEARRELEAVVEGVPEADYAEVVALARDAIKSIDEAFRSPSQATETLQVASRHVRNLRTLTADGPGHVHAERAARLFDEILISA